jgi:hypothetical protein
MSNLNNDSGVKDATAAPRYYTGIGSRETPPDVMNIITALATALGVAGFVLRSGGADGADSAFEWGARDAGVASEIYLPWKGFNGNQSELFGVTAPALELAESVHPAWQAPGQGPRKMHARNCYQVLGRSLESPSEFVVCWTPDGCETERARTRKTGGTATGIVLALRRGIEVFNLRNPGSRIRLNERLSALAIDHRVPLIEEPTAPQGALF